MGLALTPERSLAVDPRHVPPGAPVWLATTRPNSEQALTRLMLAQDTGGAIRGVVRADFYWGTEIRNYLKTAFAAAVKEHFKDATALVGVATAGIALGALVADELNLPYAYCRPKPKEHGLKNQLEGRLAPGAKIVVVEDLISTGGSSIKVVEYLREEGYDVIGMGAIFTYGFKQAVENFKEANCEFFTLSNYSDLIKKALAIGYMQKEEIEELENWRKDPGIGEETVSDFKMKLYELYLVKLI